MFQYHVHRSLLLLGSPPPLLWCCFVTRTQLNQHSTNSTHTSSVSVTRASADGAGRLGDMTFGQAATSTATAISAKHCFHQSNLYLRQDHFNQKSNYLL